ncbi:hypothetical protein S83_043224, partial [Arachis hypogaea]
VIMMRKGEVQLHARKLRSLVDLCVQKIIDNIRYLGNVGCVDLHLHKRILPHYMVDQLMRVEKGKRIQVKNCTKEVMRRMREKKVSFKRKQLYEGRQVRLCTKTPPLSKKRFWGGCTFSCLIFEDLLELLMAFYKKTKHKPDRIIFYRLDLSQQNMLASPCRRVISPRNKDGGASSRDETHTRDQETKSGLERD